jgi:hypothetical protein
MAALLSCLALVAAALPATASAGSLHRGKYQCYQFDPVSGYLYWGYVKVKGHKYSMSGGHGKWSRKGHKIRWRSGPLHSYHWTGKVVSSKKFTIIDKADGLEINCNR